MAIDEIVAMLPQAACAETGSSVRRATKYGPKTKVTTTVKNGWAAQSKSIQPQMPRRETPAGDAERGGFIAVNGPFPRLS